MKRKQTSKALGQDMDPQHWAHWWNSSPLMELNRYGYLGARKGADFWFKHYAEPRMLYAWIYELCRRLVLLRNVEEADRDVARRLPRYDLLHIRAKEALYQALFHALAAKGTAVLSRQRDPGQVEKLGDWRVIEALDAGHLADANRRSRRAKQYIKRYWAIFTAALMASDPPVLVPELLHHKLTGVLMSQDQLRAVVEKANAKFPTEVPLSELFPWIYSEPRQPHGGPKKPNVFLKAFMRPVARPFR